TLMHYLSSTSGLAMLCDAGIKGLVILGLTEGLLALWKRASAATRHSVRVAAITCVILLPVASFYTPAAGRPIWAVQSERASGNEVTLTIQLAPQWLQPAKNLQTRPRAASFPVYSGKVQFKTAWAAVLLLVWSIGAFSGFIP